VAYHIWQVAQQGKKTAGNRDEGSDSEREEDDEPTAKPSTKKDS